MLVTVVLVVILTIASDTHAKCQHHHHHHDHHHHHRSDDLVIPTPLGQIQGTTMTSRLGREIYAFRGIRYAEAPIGDLRFKPPVPTGKWDGIYNATADGSVCPQPTDQPMSEDCLFLNVYTVQLPTKQKTTKLPVIIYFHPGGFYGFTGRSNLMGPRKLLDQDVVLVTLNYRLGSLGFLSTGDELAPGNNGMKDQVVAMRWVKANIAAFGGDPDSITIMGYSAGGISVSMHLISPMSKDLFHKAISMSDTITGTFNQVTDQMDLAKKQARLLGCPEDTSANIISCLKTKSAKELGESLPKFQEFGYHPILIWYPVIEKDFGQERFMPENPYVLMQQKKIANVPAILGLTEYEFGYGAFDILRDNDLTNKLNNEWEKYAPIPCLYERDTDRSKAISKGLRDFYFGTQPISNATFDQLSELFADTISGFSVNRGLKLLSQYSSAKIYYYLFTYVGKYSHFYIPGSNNTVPYGAVHHDDLIYIFDSDYFPDILKDNNTDALMVDRLTKLYVNFANTGVPISEPSDLFDNVEWKPYDQTSQIYLEMGKKFAPKQKLFEKRYNLYDKLFPITKH